MQEMSYADEKYQQKLFFRCGFFIFILLGFGFFFPASAQQPVTGGEEGIIHVRKLKQIKGRVHLEWLYLEDNIDNLPAQKELIRSGEPVEFTSGYLYHGRDGCG
jgi:hypothetical protein